MSGNNKSAGKVTWAQAVRDTVIASMNKGQLPVLAFAGVLAVLAWRMPAEEISPLLDHILSRLGNGELLGWVIALMVMFGWYTHARWVRKEYAEEFDRIGREKTKLQENAAGKKLQGSQGSHGSQPKR